LNGAFARKCDKKWKIWDTTRKMRDRERRVGQRDTEREKSGTEREEWDRERSGTEREEWDREIHQHSI
jgi:hypothetical protein